MKLPQDFIDRTQSLLGEDWDDFVVALEDDVPTSIRVNLAKVAGNISNELSSVPWCSTGYYLPARPQFTFDPLFHSGAYYVQEASSMFIEQGIKQLIQGDVRVLDLCAAPGGKSTLLASLLSDNSLLVSNEIIRTRANILAENAMKWGYPNHVVTNNNPSDYSKLKHFFDLILIDAPCSGEGMFRKDEQAIEEWSVDNVALCAQRQKDIISSVWDALKPNGYIIYSTCTYNRDENEEILDWITTEYEASIVQVNVPQEWGIYESKLHDSTSYHFYPHKTRGEGFFCGIIQKGETEEIDTHIFKSRKNKSSKKQIAAPQERLSCLTCPEDFIAFSYKEYINAFRKDLYADLQIVQDHLNILSQGICLGQMKGKDFIPHQSLALSTMLNRDEFETCEVDWQTAISYLRSEAILLPDCARGYILLTYKNTALGFVKNIGNRANNLYPNEWRIRSANLPDSDINVL